MDVDVVNLDVVELVDVELVVQLIGLVNQEPCESCVLLNEKRLVLLARCAPGMQVRLTINSFTVLPKILQIISVDTVEVVKVVEKVLMDLDNEISMSCESRGGR